MPMMTSAIRSAQRRRRGHDSLAIAELRAAFVIAAIRHPRVHEQHHQHQKQKRAPDEQHKRQPALQVGFHLLVPEHLQKLHRQHDAEEQQRDQQALNDGGEPGFLIVNAHKPLR